MREKIGLGCSTGQDDHRHGMPTVPSKGDAVTEGGSGGIVSNSDKIMDEGLHK